MRKNVSILKHFPISPHMISLYFFKTPPSKSTNHYFTSKFLILFDPSAFFLTPLPLHVLFLNSWSYLRGSIFLSFLVFFTSVCLCYLMCELACWRTCICVETDFKKGTTPDNVISLKRLNGFGRQSGDLQTDLAWWIKLWNHSSGGQLLKDRRCEWAMHCLLIVLRVIGIVTAVSGGWDAAHICFTHHLNLSTARLRSPPTLLFSPSLLWTGEGAVRRMSERDTG